MLVLDASLRIYAFIKGSDFTIYVRQNWGYLLLIAFFAGELLSTSWEFFVVHRLYGDRRSGYGPRDEFEFVEYEISNYIKGAFLFIFVVACTLFLCSREMFVFPLATIAFIGAFIAIYFSIKEQNHLAHKECLFNHCGLIPRSSLRLLLV